MYLELRTSLWKQCIILMRLKSSALYNFYFSVLLRTLSQCLITTVRHFSI